MMLFFQPHISAERKKVFPIPPPLVVLKFKKAPSDAKLKQIVAFSLTDKQYKHNFKLQIVICHVYFNENIYCTTLNHMHTLQTRDIVGMLV